MTIFTGEYDCKVDAKGRIMLPAAFRKQMGEVEAYRFVIKKDMYEACLELYTEEEWEHQNNMILKTIKPYNPEHRQFLRDFRMGATEVECDPTGRLLIPGRLLKQADITNETVLSGNIGKIEIWSPALYGNSGGDTATKRDRAERIMGDAAYNIEPL
jgi:MraZ protein